MYPFKSVSDPLQILLKFSALKNRHTGSGVHINPNKCLIENPLASLNHKLVLFTNRILFANLNTLIGKNFTFL